jgi:hypothetical protein
MVSTLISTKEVGYLLFDSIMGKRYPIYLVGRCTKGGHHPEQGNSYEDEDHSSPLVTPNRFTAARHHVSRAFHSLDVLGSVRRTRKPWKRVGHDGCGWLCGGLFVELLVDWL